MATLKVYAGFGSTWLTEPGAISWTDLTPRVMDRRQVVNLVRGSTASHGEPDTGQANLTLRNTDRMLDPKFATGDHFGQLVPGVPIKFEAQIEGATDNLVWDVDDLDWGTDELLWGAGSIIPLWRGTVNAWPQRYDRGNESATVPLTAFDGFDKGARAKIPWSVLDAEVLADSPRGYWRLDETSGTVMSDHSGNQRHGTYVAGTTSLAGSIEAGDVVTPALVLEGEHQAHVNMRLTGYDLSNAIGCLIDLTSVDDLVNGEQLVIAEYGHGLSPGTVGTAGFFGAPFQWGVEVISASAKTARLFLRGPIAWPNFTYSGSFSYATPRHIATRSSMATTPGTNHYVDGVITNGSTSTALLSGQQLIGLRVLGNKGNDKNWRGGIAGLFWNDHTSVTSARIAAYAEAALAPLDDQTTDERIGWVLDQIGWPVGLRDLEAGQQTLGPAVIAPGDLALGYMRQVARTEAGQLFLGPDGTMRLHDRYWRHVDPLATTSQLTLADDGSGIGVATFDWDPQSDELLVNVARFTRRGGVEQVAVDETSRDAYGEAELQRDDLLLRTDPETQSLAEWTVVTRSTPTDRVRRVLIRLHKLSAADQATVLGLDLGHRVTCARTPQGVGTAYSIECVVDGIKHDISAVEWLVELYLSPALDSSVTLFTLGTSELGSADILAF
jgi:hypothetical protein